MSGLDFALHLNLKHCCSVQNKYDKTNDPEGQGHRLLKKNSV